MNLDPAESWILEEFHRQGRGQLWLTRPLLKRGLWERNPRGFGERTFDNALNRLIRRDEIVRYVTDDHGAFYVTAESARRFPEVEHPLRRMNARGKRSVVMHPHTLPGRPIISLTFNEPSGGRKFRPRKVA